MSSHWAYLSIQVQFSCVCMIVAFLIKKIIILCIHYRWSQVGHTRSRYISRSLFTLCIRWNNSKRLSVWWASSFDIDYLSSNALFVTHTHNLLKATMLCVFVLLPSWPMDSCNVEDGGMFFWLKRCNLNNIPSRDWLTVAIADNIIPFLRCLCVLNMWGVCIHDFINKRKREK